MTRYDYIRAVWAAVREHLDEIIDEFPEVLDGQNLKEANDELMAAVWEHTKDGRSL